MSAITWAILASYRWGASLHHRGLTPAASLLKMLMRVLFSVEIDFRADLQRDLQIPHPAGVVIGRGSRIGSQVQLGAGVVLGGNFGQVRAGRTYPHLGSHILVGPGAALLGPISICDGVVIGANSVVTRDIMTSGVYAGMPAERLRPLSPTETLRLGLAADIDTD